MATIRAQILAAFSRKGRGKVFTSKDFLHIGSREAVDQTLSRLARTGTVCRLGRGLYHYPRLNPRLGIPIAPDADEIASALGRKTGSRIAPSGAVAANRLGLTTQVPAQTVYLTDGQTRKVRVGNTTYFVKHVAPKELPLGRPTSALVFQALRHMGREHVDDQVVGRLRAALSEEDRQKLLEDARYVTGWIGEVIRKVVAVDTQEAGAHG